MIDRNSRIILIIVACVGTLVVKKFYDNRGLRDAIVNRLEAKDVGTLLDSEKDRAFAKRFPMFKNDFGGRSVQELPPASKNIWTTQDYQLLPDKDTAVVGFKKDGQSFYLLKSKLSPCPCVRSEHHEAPRCLRMPNGQVLEVTPELAARIPQWRVYNSYDQWRISERLFSKTKGGSK